MKLGDLPLGSASLRSRAPTTDPRIWPKRFRVQVTLATGVLVEAWGETAAEALTLLAAGDVPS